MLLKYIQNAIVRLAVEELYSFWQASIHLGTTGQGIRDEITRALPMLTEDLQLKPCTSFCEFIREYDLREYSQFPEDPNRCLLHYARQGKLRLCKIAIEQGANNVVSAFFEALQSADIPTIKYFLTQNLLVYPHGVMFSAASSGSRDVVNLVLNKYYDHYGGLTGAASSGNWDLVNFFSNRASSSQPSDEIMGYRIAMCAAENGHSEIAKFFFEKDPKYADSCAMIAASSGNMELTKFFLQQSPGTDVFGYACLGGNLELVKYSWSSIPDDPYTAASNAAKRGHIHILDFILNKLSGMSDFPNVVNYALNFASGEKQLVVIEYLIDKYGDILDWNSGMLGASGSGYISLVKEFEAKGANNYKKCAKVARENRYRVLAEYLESKL